MTELAQATENLTQASHKMSEQLYRASQGGAGPEGLKRGAEQEAARKAAGAEGQEEGQKEGQNEGQNEGKNPDDVIDADFKEVG